MATTAADIEEFLDGPLVTWVRSCLDDPRKLSEFDDLSDGVLIYQVLLLIDPEPVHQGVRPCMGNHALRTRNMESIVRNINNLYEEELCQVVLQLPNCLILGRQPATKQGLQEMNLLLLLLLGCAVQCPNKQTFIEQIKTLPIQSQHLLVDCIKQVTESQEIVLTPEGFDSISNEIMLEHIKKLAKQREHLLQHVSCSSEEKKPGSQVSLGGMESQHLAVELADWKAKYRKQRQELEEKTEALVETREELDHNKSLVSKLKNEMNNLKTAARVGKAYRDEADSLREKAERCDRFEAEVNKYKEKLSDLEYYRVRVEELRQDNLVLEETREMLEEELGKVKQRLEYTAKLEEDLVRTKQQVNELTLEKDAHEEKMQELFEENAQLALLSRSVLQPSSLSDSEQADETSAADNSLSEQLSSNAQARVLRLELENKRLSSTVENLHEANLNQTNDRILQLEKDKKKLSLQVEELEEAKSKLVNQISELESAVKNSQRDTRKMQDIRDSLQTQLQSRVEEVERAGKDKSRLERRVSELEQILDQAKKDMVQLEGLSDYKTRVQSLEKELNRLKHTLEAKSVDLDKMQNDVESLAKEKSQLSEQLDEANSQIARLVEVEKELKEAESAHEIDKAALVSLERDLVQEKMNSQQLQNCLDKLGLPLESLSDPDNTIDRVMSNPEVARAVSERLQAAQSDSRMQVARLQVHVTTLQAQVSSLTAQHTALQLANSQLVVEKDELTKEVEGVKRDYQQTCVDQLTLQSIHEQLSSQYESLLRESQQSKHTLRETRQEMKSLKERLDLMTQDNASLSQEKDRLHQDNLALNNLKNEHSKLKEDFRCLFTANEKLKTEYRAAQEEYKGMRSEARQAKQALDRCEEELARKAEHLAQAELQLTKALTQCEVLRTVKSNLEEDRRSLMEHVTLLLGQYHELLTHSLEDKEQYHLEEKIFTDKLNNLSRQKEKLEEKIMEHYRRMESTHSKKKGFGASFVRKMRKAGSDLINKGRKSWHEDASRASRGTDSDTSLEEVRTKQESLGVPGSRRTLYLSADDVNPPQHPTNNENNEESKVSSAEPPSTSTPNNQGGVVVYNRVTTVMGGGSGNSSPSCSPANTLQSRKQSTDRTNKQDVWFEYGCV